jgi:two-component system sensor histidine kinase PhcS
MTDKIKELYLESDKELRIKRSILGCILCIIFVPAGSIVDYFLYHDFLWSFLSIRIICALITAVILLLHFTKLGRKNFRYLTASWLLLVSITMCYIIFIGDKSLSTYYTALSIFVFSVAVIVPLSTIEMLLFCAVTIISYLAAAIQFPLQNLLFNNLYFIVLTSIISTISAHLNSKFRFTEFCLNFDLKDTINKLQSTQAQLVHSEKINAIGSLSAGLLHEVNNPLNYTMTALQIMKMDPNILKDEDLKDTLKDMEEGMTRIKNIVTDLRAFAYPEEVDKKYNFPIQSAVESALRFTANETRDIQKIIDVAPDLMVSASKSHIVQVLINLISNAMKAIRKAHREKGVITISAKKEKNRVVVSVSDNGIGMNDETLKKVFDPFFTTNEVGKGMGLGLSVSYTIIKNHEGNLSAESKLGEGSRFFFDLSN